MQPPPQDNQLMSKHRVLSSKPQLRLECEARSLIAKGAAGILSPSFATGARPDMANLILWRWGSELPHKVEVHDPSGRLPKDQSSWPDA